jgi:hypothetical protein
VLRARDIGSRFGVRAPPGRDIRDPRHRVPDWINRVTREELLPEMTDMLAHGSPALQRDVERYRDLVLRHAPRLDTLEHIGQFVADAWREWISQ